MSFILENYTLRFRNLYILTLKRYCFRSQTLVFGKSNNIVSPPKQYCFVRESQMFGKWNTKTSSFIRWKESRVNKSDGNKREGYFRLQENRWTVFHLYTWQMESTRNLSATICILRIVWEGPRNPRKRILVRGRAPGRASFDKMSIPGSDGTGRQSVRSSADRKGSRMKIFPRRLKTTIIPQISLPLQRFCTQTNKTLRTQ